jgi:hypothetical protein
MGSSPVVTSLLFVLLGAGFVLYTFRRGKAMRQRLDRDTAQARAGALAQRLGLQLERGDPGFNLQHAPVGALEHQAVDVLLRGAPHGVPLEIVYFRKVEDATTGWQAFAGERTTKIQWDCRITAHMAANIGRFEIRLRAPNAACRVRSYFGDDPPPARSFADLELDRVLVIGADDPDVAMRLASLVRTVATMQYVHIVGERGRVSFEMGHGAFASGMQMAVGPAYGFSAIDPIVHTLTTIACALDGRPAPGAIIQAAPAADRYA